MTADLHVPSFVSEGNWLLTSAAAKVDLTLRMRTAVNHAGLSLYAADCSPWAVAFEFADGSVLLPPIEDPGFLKIFIAECQQRNIRIVLPTRDADALFFSQHASKLQSAGIWPLVSSHKTVATCCDKIRFDDHCRGAHLPVLPRITTLDQCEYPCFVRRRRGAGGRGARPVLCAEEMAAILQNAALCDLLIQPLCNHAEYSIDALAAPDGRLVQWVVRERIQLKAGESVISRTTSIPALNALVQQLAASIPFFGPITVQAFYSEEKGPFLIEANPRFGGASALGIEAGLQTPERLVALTRGNINRFEQCADIQSGLMMLRYSKDIFRATGDCANED